MDNNLFNREKNTSYKTGYASRESNPNRISLKEKLAIDLGRLRGRNQNDNASKEIRLRRKAGNSTERNISKNSSRINDSLISKSKLSLTQRISKREDPFVVTLNKKRRTEGSNFNSTNTTR